MLLERELKFISNRIIHGKFDIFRFYLRLTPVFLFLPPPLRKIKQTLQLLSCKWLECSAVRFLVHDAIIILLIFKLYP